MLSCYIAPYDRNKNHQKNKSIDIPQPAPFGRIDTIQDRHLFLGKGLFNISLEIENIYKNHLQMIFKKELPPNSEILHERFPTGSRF